ncbi:MAG: hypothetical protein NZ480_05365 [Bdellovibrionaceae bacterium]|nr:hypothetical protein [Pseudobdellovibrionaceae bacterium]MDW8190402.1 hypothetical protein [Pseudobdellovibrionaceae bacterium]
MSRLMRYSHLIVAVGILALVKTTTFANKITENHPRLPSPNDIREFKQTIENVILGWSELEAAGVGFFLAEGIRGWDWTKHPYHLFFRSILRSIKFPIRLNSDQLSQRFAELALSTSLLSFGIEHPLTDIFVSSLSYGEEETGPLLKYRVLWRTVFNSIMDIYLNEYQRFTPEEKTAFLLITLHFLQLFDVNEFNKYVDQFPERADAFLKHFVFNIILPEFKKLEKTGFNEQNYLSKLAAPNNLTGYLLSGVIAGLNEMAAQDTGKVERFIEQNGDTIVNLLLNTPKGSIDQRWDRFEIFRLVHQSGSKSSLLFYQHLARIGRLLFEKPDPSATTQREDNEIKPSSQRQFIRVFDGFSAVMRKSVSDIILDRDESLEVRLLALNVWGFHGLYHRFEKNIAENMAKNVANWIELFLQQEEPELLARLLYLLSAQSTRDPNVFSLRTAILNPSMVNIITGSTHQDSRSGSHHSAEEAFILWLSNLLKVQLMKVFEERGADGVLEYVEKMKSVSLAMAQYFNRTVVIDVSHNRVEVHLNMHQRKPGNPTIKNDAIQQEPNRPSPPPCRSIFQKDGGVNN